MAINLDRTSQYIPQRAQRTRFGIEPTAQIEILHCMMLTVTLGTVDVAAKRCAALKVVMYQVR